MLKLPISIIGLSDSYIPIHILSEERHLNGYANLVVIAQVTILVHFHSS